jgi:putative endonuclease
MAAHNELGKQGEDLAAGLLEAKGYFILDRNYQFERAEVDIVALRLDPGEVVFVEVKTRSSDLWGYPEEAVTEAKKKLLYKAADSYIYERQLFTVPARFDIISVGLADPENPVFQHLEDAFRMNNRPW